MTENDTASKVADPQGSTGAAASQLPSQPPQTAVGSTTSAREGEVTRPEETTRPEHVLAKQAEPTAATKARDEKIDEIAGRYEAEGEHEAAEAVRAKLGPKVPASQMPQGPPKD